MSLYIICFTISAVATHAQSTYKGLPVIEAIDDLADYRINNEWSRGSWTIMPHIAYDTLKIACFAAVEDFVFYTDKDSITLKVKAGEAQSFYVHLNDTAYARTVIYGHAPTYKALAFEKGMGNKDISFRYEQNRNNTFLDSLRRLYPIDSLVVGAATDMQKALNILHWVHNQWQHNGDNQPSHWDAITILNEAGQGNKFRCVEYGVVASACLNAVGLPARTLALKTKDVAITEYGAGHVLTEVYLLDMKKWVLLDGQWDAMPVLNGTPLNAVEFQKAIAEDFHNLEIKTASGTAKRNYISWIYPYLFYFDVRFDQREGNVKDRLAIDGKPRLMLVPLGAENPTIFQVKSKINNCLYTNSVDEFYLAPAFL